MSFTGRKLHLIGIGGAGMSGLALAAREQGAQVSGSDRSQSSYVERLVAAGVDVSIGHDAANVPEDADVVVSTAIGDDNPELIAARESGATILHRSDLLSEFVALRNICIAVAGTHGKTTTTAMIAHILHELGEDPSFFVGGEVEVGGVVTNAHMGTGPIVVVEADESDGSFLKLDPQIAIITNVEMDHHSTWTGGMAQLFEAFDKFATPADTVVTWAGQPELAGDVTFGIAPDTADVLATALETPADPHSGTEYALGEAQVKLGVRGSHNVLNSLAALTALEAAGVPIDRAAPALASFKGVARRFEHVGTALRADIYDDYAHHPTEVVAALTTAQATTRGRTVAVFQPHLYSRTESFAAQFGEALAIADVVVVMDIYAAREDPADFPAVTGQLVADKVLEFDGSKPVHFEPTEDRAVGALKAILQPNDLCITIGAGDVFRVGRRLIEETS